MAKKPAPSSSRPKPRGGLGSINPLYGSSSVIKAVADKYKSTTSKKKGK